MKIKLFISIGFLSLSLAIAQNNITEAKSSVSIKVDGKEYTIERIQGKDVYLTNEFSLTSRPSPPFFIQPFKVTDDVDTYGELEVIDFLEKGKGVFIDARLESWYKNSYIAGAVNIPFKLFLKDSKKRDKILKGFGAVKKGKKWDFTKAKTILFYCNGSWCVQSPTAIHALKDIGYPEVKMKYYRGGIQSWQLVGLTVINPKKEAKK
jgi:rhodanese-related sulfurtransferase